MLKIMATRGETNSSKTNEVIGLWDGEKWKHVYAGKCFIKYPNLKKI